MSKLRILLTVTTDLTYDQRMQRICDALAEAGHTVTLVGRVRTNSLPLTERKYRRHRIACRYQSGKAFYFEYNLRLYRYLRKQSFDVLCAVDLDTIVAVAHAAAAADKPFTYDAHEYFSETPEVERRPMIKRIWETVARRYVPRAAVAYTVGPQLAGQLSARYKIPFGVVRNAARYDLDFKPDMANAEPRIILYQGALNEGRGLVELIKAAALLTGVQIQLAGEGDLSASLRALVQRLGLSERVQFLGYVKPGVLVGLTRRAWLGYNLLEDRGLSYHYSLANKTFDYYQAGIPALHSDLPEYRSLFREYGGIVLADELSAEAVATIVKGLLAAPDRYAALRAACIAARVSLAWRHEAERLCAIYAALSSSAK